MGGTKWRKMWLQSVRTLCRNERNTEHDVTEIRTFGGERWRRRGTKKERKDVKREGKGGGGGGMRYRDRRETGRRNRQDRSKSGERKK